MGQAAKGKFSKLVYTTQKLLALHLKQKTEQHKVRKIQPG